MTKDNDRPIEPAVDGFEFSISGLVSRSRQQLSGVAWTSAKASCVLSSGCSRRHASLSFPRTERVADAISRIVVQRAVGAEDLLQNLLTNRAGQAFHRYYP